MAMFVLCRLAQRKSRYFRGAKGDFFCQSTFNHNLDRLHESRNVTEDFAFWGVL
jgi:hypothetical protein